MRSTARGWRGWIGLAGAVVLGCVLLLAAWAKAIDPEAFAEQIRAEALDFWLPAWSLVFLALACELGLGVLLASGVRRAWVLVPATLLVAFFLWLTGRAYWRWSHGLLDEASRCGCFGNLVERTPAEAFWMDLLLLAPATAAAWLGLERRRPFPRLRALLAVAVTAAGLALAWKAPDLPLDDLATRLRPGLQISSLCAGAADDPERICLDALVPELEDGEHWVVIADVDDEAFLAQLDRLHEYALSGSEPRLWVLADLSQEELYTFTWEHGPAFDLRIAPAALLRPLYRHLPRTFRVRDGRVVETMPGLPELK